MHLILIHNHSNTCHKHIDMKNNGAEVQPLCSVSNVGFLLHITVVIICSPLLHYTCIIITGKHISYTHLDYVSRNYGGITSINNHVMVAEFSPPAVHIYQLPHGATLRSIRCQELRLGANDVLQGVNLTDLLHLAVGLDIWSTKSLHTYQVNTLSFQVACPCQLLMIQINFPHCL